MNKIKKCCACLIVSSVAFASSAEATIFWHSGKIIRTITDQYFAGCMVLIDNPVNNTANTCPEAAWISLDCDGLFNNKNIEHGNRMYSMATAAAMAGKTVSLLIDDAYKVNGYCVASRIDVIF